MKNGKRTLAKKVTSFVLYVDQVSQIQAIVEATGAEKDAQVLRDLIDEALIARRRKTAQQLTLPEQAEQPLQSTQDLETIQVLLLKLIEESQKARQVRGVCLELLQEILAEAHASRVSTSQLETSDRPDLALSHSQLQLQPSRHYAYTVTEEIWKSLKETPSTVST